MGQGGDGGRGVTRGRYVCPGRLMLLTGSCWEHEGILVRTVIVDLTGKFKNTWHSVAHDGILVLMRAFINTRALCSSRGHSGAHASILRARGHSGAHEGILVLQRSF